MQVCKKWKEQEWSFLNMNSPADLYAVYDKETVTLMEYDRCRDGHALISKFYVDGNDIFFQSKIEEMGSGVGVGLYYGDGCYSCYCMAVVDKNGISIRIPNKVPNGDTFRADGPFRYYTAVSVSMEVQSSFTIGFSKERDRITIYLDESAVLKRVKMRLPFPVQNSSARLIVKAMNEYCESTETAAVLAAYSVNKQMDSYCLNGICIDKLTHQKLANVYVHVLGDFEKCAITDREGKFTIAGLPFGEYRLVFGMAGREFESVTNIHDGHELLFELTLNSKQERSHIPQENLRNNLPFQALNGLWKFDFDKADKGKQEKWFQKDAHIYSKCIRVPFSWQSLAAFGEEELADAYSLHHANTYTSNAAEVGETGWYQRSFYVDWENKESETELVFGAVSGISKIWLDEEEIGCIVDSYNKYVFCLGKLIPGREYTLTVRVSYEHGNNWACSGKQGFWFTDSPGIWQNVWLRERRMVSITDILVKNSIQEKDGNKLNIQIELDAGGNHLDLVKLKDNDQIMVTVLHSGYVKISTYYQTMEEIIKEVVINGSRTGIEICFDAVHGTDYYDKKVFYLYLNAGENKVDFYGKTAELTIIKAELQMIQLDFKMALFIDGQQIGTPRANVNLKNGKLEAAVCHKMESVKLWSDHNPYLYQLTAKLEEKGLITEYVRNVGFRTAGISEKDDKNGSYITLNGRKKYIRGVLDQGYNPWGIYTYTNIEGNLPGSVEFDISAAKQCGFNLMRMHIKDNEPEWYKACDTLGMLVWDELPSNFYGTAADQHWQSMYKRQLKQMVKKHNYHPSVILFSTINESWGITGDHEKSPWDDIEGQRLIKEYAEFYKNHAPNVLVVDNSGYAKTAATQVIDHHAYPNGYQDAADFFRRLEKQNYEGSFFNFFNMNNQNLMQQDEIRDLLQRNCSQDLKSIAYKGNEIQENQPVLISEFVHSDKQEELVRIFPQIAGYVRMNIASQENEDTSPLTSTRTWRNFGFVKSDFTDAGYEMANHENLLFLEYPFLTKAVEQEIVRIPVILSLWEESLSKTEHIVLKWEFIGIDYNGTYKNTGIGAMIEGSVLKEKPIHFTDIELLVPKGYKAGYLFAKVLKNNDLLAENYIQLEIFAHDQINILNRKATDTVELLPKHISSKSGFLYSDLYEALGRNLFWGYGEGEIIYQLPVPTDYFTKAKLSIELSACNCINGVRETDESLECGEVQIYVQDLCLAVVTVSGQASDRKGLFSNSASTAAKIVKYSETGVYGYGERIEIEFSKEIIDQINQRQFITISLKTQDKGIVIYGNRMGRYGCNPVIIRE